MCARILRAEADNLPLSPDFTIFDEDDQTSIMKKVIKELNLPETNFPPKKVLNIISLQKNNLVTPDIYAKSNDSYYANKIGKIYEHYQKYLISNNGVDFDDLLIYTVQLFESKPDILKKYQKKFQYIMIDEYQDTNFAQYRFAYLLAKSHTNICVVGDDDQSIYSWRGADIRNILSFEDDYASPKVIRMTQNYRSPAVVLAAANELIANNKSRHPKELWTANPEGDKIKLYECQDGSQEAMAVANRIKELVTQGDTEYRDIAIFYRTNAQSREFESRFIREQIDYQVVGGVNFYQRKEIKDVLAYLKVLANPMDNESLLRIINFPKRGIGTTTVARLIEFGAEKGISLYQALQHLDDIKVIEHSRNKVIEHSRNKVIEHSRNTALPSASYKSLKSFYLFMEELRVEAESLPINELMKLLVEKLNLLEIYKDEETVEGETRADNVKELIASTDEFVENYLNETGQKPGLAEYLQDISLLADIDRTSSTNNVVSLMTMHNAKGLEFPYVFIVGAEEGLIPHSNSMESLSQIEEERRLFYVAMTRTIKELTISYANSRRIYNSLMPALPSRFIGEMVIEHSRNMVIEHSRNMDSKWFERITFDEQTLKDTSFYAHANKRTQYNWNTDHEKFRVGQRVSHPEFGKGIILSVRNEGELTKLTVSFDNGSLKKIIADYIKIL
jgi:DNA helicase-2/ATP-dependent DNA helicase PcrA